jgi:hypothetical protein
MLTRMLITERVKVIQTVALAQKGTAWATSLPKNMPIPPPITDTSRGIKA